MKVADAITPIARTLRPGRSAALRKPTRQSDCRACPANADRGGRRRTDVTANRHATRNDVPAPKNAPVRSIARVNASASRTAPTMASAVAVQVERADDRADPRAA